MIALMHDSFGDPADVVRAREAAEPQPRAGEVRLRVLASPIHNHDLATIRGTYGYKPNLPAVAGSELIGVIDALGEGVQGLREGMRVAGVARGGWAEEVVLPAAGVVPIPDGIDDERGAQLIAMPLSAVVLFNELRTQKGMWIAQNAASGAVGRILMQIAQRSEVNIVNFVRRDEAADDLRSHGAKHVVVTSRDGWAEEALGLTGGEGFARIVDSVAGAQSLELQRLLALNGELIVFGALSAGAMKLDPGRMISHQLIVRGFWATTWMMRATEQEREKARMTVFELASKGELPLPIGGVYSLEQAAEAISAAQTPGRAGKIIFKMNPK